MTIAAPTPETIPEASLLRDGISAFASNRVALVGSGGS